MTPTKNKGKKTGMSGRRSFGKDGTPICTVCKHKERDRIDAYLLSGASPGYVAKRFDNIKVGAVRRHKVKHLESILPSRIAPPDVTKCTGKQLEMGDIAGQVRALYKEARDDMEQAKKAGDLQTSLRGNAQALRCLEVYFKASEAAFKLQKDSGGKADISKLRSVLMAALDKYPAAKQSVAKALVDSKLF